LVATTALYLNALAGEGCHLVTVNDYLVRRDAGWMGRVFAALDMTTSAIAGDLSLQFDPGFVNSEASDERLQHLRPIERRAAYRCDITYADEQRVRVRLPARQSGVRSRGHRSA